MPRLTPPSSTATSSRWSRTSGRARPSASGGSRGPRRKACSKSVAALLSPIAADTLTPADDGGADLIPLIPSGVPQLGMALDATTYFDYHHTANDTFDRIDPRILDRSTAAVAVAAYVLAETPQTLERVPVSKRVLPAWAK